MRPFVWYGKYIVALQRIQSLVNIRKYRRRQVGLQKSVAQVHTQFDLKLLAGCIKRRLRQAPEVFIAAHERAQPGIFDLPLTPQRCKVVSVGTDVMWASCNTTPRTSNKVPYASKTIACGVMASALL